MAKLITVFGATGNQGGSVIRAILADPKLKGEFNIRGVTRDLSKPAAEELKKMGVELVNADMNSPASVASAVEGAHTVFLVTNFWETLSMETEYSQGKNVADACKSANVSHLIFSSLIHVTEATSGALKNVPHFDGKAQIERYIRELNIPSTFVLPGYFMSNLVRGVKKGEDGVYAFPLPVTETSTLPFFDVVADMGKYVIAAMKQRSSLLGARLYAAADYYLPERIVREFTEVSGHPAKVIYLQADEYLQTLPPAIGRELLEMHQLLETPGYYAGADLKESLEVLDSKSTTWKEFVAKTEEWK